MNLDRPLHVRRVSTWALIGLMSCFAIIEHVGAEAAGVSFTDKTKEMGLEISTSAACWADFNNDGWLDLCVAGGVWMNQRGKGFVRTVDVGTAVAADYDNDGFVDLFSWSSRRLFHNDTGKGFTETKLPDLPASVSRGACWGDFNGDGFVDLYLAGYEDWAKGITWPSLVLISDRGKTFRLGRTEERYRTRGVTACDFDRDGDLDLYVSNYRLQPNLLWLNDGSGQFREAAREYGVVATSPGFRGGHSIGAAWGDFDSDGEIDLFAGNFAHRDRRGNQPQSRFLRNLGAAGQHKFKDLGPCGVHYQESYATPAVADYDHDGRLDLFLTTVYGTASFGRKNHPVLFRNTGAFAFTDTTAPARLSGLGPTYQAAWGDYDNDGDLDLVTAGKLFQNEGTRKRWLKIRLEGDGVRVNRSAVGAQVRIKLPDRTLVRQVEAGTGEGNQNELTLHFGLGEQGGPVDLGILWPDKSRQVVQGVQADQLLEVRFQSPHR
ncbi:MAG: CRTAC1 family protein [Phycisphaerae bacterium]|nr:CRTAC1 family protein [Phycisphaerae bacterium]